MEYGKGSLWPESAETLQHGRKISLITRCPFSRRLESSIRLVRDRFTPRGAYTSRLSKFCSKTSYENLYREGFPAAQQFFHTNLAARRCYWHNNRYTIG
ncbi:hypothetical protein PVAP13_J669301 [Panicum virgatum]|nr:hypothetical protein PVAP13_J669301 [Panicum virgatum]